MKFEDFHVIFIIKFYIYNGIFIKNNEKTSVFGVIFGLYFKA